MATEWITSENTKDVSVYSKYFFFSEHAKLGKSFRSKGYEFEIFLLIGVYVYKIIFFCAIDCHVCRWRVKVKYETSSMSSTVTGTTEYNRTNLSTVRVVCSYKILGHAVLVSAHTHPRCACIPIYSPTRFATVLTVCTSLQLRCNSKR